MTDSPETIYEAARTRIRWAEEKGESVMVIIGDERVTYCHTPGMFAHLLRKADELHQRATGADSLLRSSTEGR